MHFLRAWLKIGDFKYGNHPSGSKYATIQFAAHKFNCGLPVFHDSSAESMSEGQLALMDSVELS